MKKKIKKILAVVVAVSGFATFGCSNDVSEVQTDSVNQIASIEKP
ncbi:hypothetical protein Hs30E_16750 [Lactococcus hodotermopsidis]|uniref:Lipoprotein n=1 Tax=Pseudolactococcus hodotermopsidis TaxID=2709157 RepID=A0A6A0BF92_9LACT|nr:hypothetical protein [Lactococcus hodotermopsidis]GFH43124.1 hypothetical protein Hs30E_16750 [Lactococcus hodotermopsidis]